MRSPNDHRRQVTTRCYPHLSPLRVLGAALLAAGLMLMFLCIPGWAWAALAGAALIVIGYALITLAAK